MMNAYLDECGIHDKAEVCVIAGFFGEVDPMRQFASEWRRTLSTYRFPPEHFLAKNLLGRPQYIPLLSALLYVIAKQEQVYPISQAILVEDFFACPLSVRNSITGGGPSRSATSKGQGFPNKPHFVPFQTCLRMITDCTPDNKKAHFAFALENTFAGQALSLSRQIHKQLANGSYGPLWKSSDRLGVLTFPSASQTPQLQAADLLAHLSYLRILEGIEEGEINNRFDSGEPGLNDCLRNVMKPEHHGIICRERILEWMRDLVKMDRTAAPKHHAAPNHHLVAG